MSVNCSLQSGLYVSFYSVKYGISPTGVRSARGGFICVSVESGISGQPEADLRNIG